MSQNNHYGRQTSTALWIIVILLTIIVMFFVGSCINAEVEKREESVRLLDEMERSQKEYQDDLYRELTNKSR